MWILNKSHCFSFRRAATFTLAVLVVPLFIVMILFNSYTIYQQQVTIRGSRVNTLRVYQTRWEETISMLEDYLADTVANNADFSDMVYASTKVRAYLASLRLDSHTRTLLRAYELLGAFFLYADSFDYYRLIYTDSYPLEDLDVLRWKVIESAQEDTADSRWEWVELSDRTVLLYTYNFHGTVAASMAQIEAIRTEKTGEAPLDKPTFGSCELGQLLKAQDDDLKKQGELGIESITLIGLCTDICVISNAMIVKAFLPEVPVKVDAACCAGVTPESHKNALEAMKVCQIEVTE